jgi:hypothetical protein
MRDMRSSLSQPVGHCIQHAPHTILAVQHISCLRVAQHIVLNLLLHFPAHLLVFDNLQQEGIDLTVK